MAGLWYRVGTVSVTNGSKKVTGFGSQWKSTVYKPDKGHALYGPDGQAYEIDYVESDTVLYLVLAYAGATAASQAYSIDITRTGTIPAFSRELSAQLAYAQSQYDSWQQILTGVDMVTLTAPDGQQVQVPSLLALQPKDATLTAMAGVATSADKVILFTGQDTATSMTVTAASRAVLDDATTADMLATLRAIGVSDADVTTQDWNTLIVTGIYKVRGATGANKPNTYQYGVLVVTNINGVVEQTYYPHDPKTAVGIPSTIVRRQSWSGGASWEWPWDYGYGRANILGTVSQSGGVPTGAIIESDSNANGVYVKFANGTLICLHLLAASNTAPQTWYYPVVFSGEPYIFITPDTDVPTFASAQGVGTSSSKFNVWNLAGGRVVKYFRTLAVGRWYN